MANLENRLQTMQQCWTNFLNSDSEGQKEEHLWEFFYYSNFVKCLHEQSFLRTAPSHLCSYLLQSISAEISKAYNTTGQRIGLCFQMIQSDFYQFVLSSPSDITGITSLRIFLTHGLGHHILQFLSVCDISQIPSCNILCHLLFKLFPNSRWDSANNDAVKSANSIDLLAVINNFLIMSTAERKSLTMRHSNNTENELDIANSETLDSFRQKHITSQQLATIIIELLSKITQNDSDNRVSMQCFEFSLKMLTSNDLAKSFPNMETVKTIKLQLLNLIATSLNNTDGNWTNIIQKLCTILENTKSIDIHLGILYISYGILHNCINMQFKKWNCLNDIIGYYYNGEPLDVTNFVNAMTTTFCKYFAELLVTTMTSIEKLNMNRKARKKSQIANKYQLHCKKPEVYCLVQSTLLKILPKSSTDVQRKILKYIETYRICCCMLAINLLDIFLLAEYDYNVQKAIYTYISRYLLPAVGQNACLHGTYEVISANNCNCETKSTQFYENIIKSYKEKMLNFTNFPDFMLFLKHLQNSICLLPTNEALEVFLEVILPLLDGQEPDRIQVTVAEHNCIVLQCLQIVVACNLSSKEIVKMYYVPENIKRLEELLHNRLFGKCICQLVKNGIDNFNYLSDDGGLLLYELQLNWSCKVLQEIGGKLKIDIEESYTNWSGYDCMPIAGKLELAAILWSYNCELFRSNNNFRREFSNRFALSLGGEANSMWPLPDFIYNFLQTFLSNHRNRQINTDSDNRFLFDYNKPTCNQFGSDNGSNQSSWHRIESTSDMLSFDEVTQHFEGDRTNSSVVLNYSSLQTNSKLLLFDIKNQNGTIFENVYNYFFGEAGLSNISNNNKSSCGDEEVELLIQNEECTRYMLKLFECTLTILLIHNSSDGNVSKMRSYLRKLKNVIISSAAENHSNGSTENANEIIQALQSLLNVAETSNNNSRVRMPQPSTGKRKPNGSGGSANDDSYMEYYYTTSKRSEEIEFEFTEAEQRAADEGYEADAEIDCISDDEDDDYHEHEQHLDMIWNPFVPSSRYRSHIVHDGLCRLITDILICLSNRCIQNPLLWAGHLSKLANRLYLLRDSLGGSLLLLKGFSLILQSTDPLLKDFQQSILNLVTDITSPEALLAYIENLSSANPPVDVLVKYLVYITRNTNSRQPRLELIFPVKKDFIKPDVKCPILESMKTIYTSDSHFTRDTTSFAKSACIIPLINAPATGIQQGFTISTWLQVKAINSTGAGFTTSTQMNLENAPKGSGKSKTHLVSVVNSQLLFSVFITNSSHFLFEVSIPIANMKFPNSDQQSCKMHKNCQKGIQCPSNKENAMPLMPPSVFKNTILHTKSKILNSFNHLISSSNDIVSSCSVSSVELHHLAVPKGKWCHLCFAVNLKIDYMEITTIVDGVQKFVVNLEYMGMKKTHARSGFDALLYGDTIAPSSFDNGNSTQNDLEAAGGGSSIGVACGGVHYGISNILLFRKAISDRDTICHLTAIGPNVCNLNATLVGSHRPNYGYLNYNQPLIYNPDQFDESIKLLSREQTFYLSPSQPGQVIYTMLTKDGTINKVAEGVLFGNLKKHTVKSFQTSTILSGGLSLFLYLFARVVEMTTDSIVQSLSLELLFDVALTDATLYAEFVRRDFLCLISNVIKTDLCAKDTNLVKAFINSACSQPIVTKRAAEELQLIENTTATLVYPNIMIKVIANYSDWYRSETKNVDVLAMLLKSIAVLVRDKHPHKNFNLNQLATAGMVKELLNFCKVCIVESTNPVLISTDCADLIVDILRIFAGSPPAPCILDELMKLLIMLQRPSECFITHDRTKLYFLVNLESASKDTRNASHVKNGTQIRNKRKYSMNYLATCPLTSPKEVTNRKYVRKKSAGTNITHVFSNIETLHEIANLKSNGLLSIYKRNLAKMNFYGKQFVERNPHTVFKRKRHFASQRKSSLKYNNNPNFKETDVDFDPRGYDIIDHDEVLTTTRATKSKLALFSLSDNSFYTWEGVIRLQENILILLKDFLLILPDNNIEMVLGHYIRIETLLVLSNNRSSSIRATILRLIAAIYARLSPSEINGFTKKHYWHHLANQMALYPVEMDLFEATVQSVTSSIQSLDDFATQKEIRITNYFAVNTLLAILPQICSPESSAKAFLIIRNIFIRDLHSSQLLIDAGLVQVVVKSLYFALKRSATNNCLREICNVMKVITEMSIKSLGQINNLWDLLNFLSFYRNNEVVDSVVNGIRSAQSQMLHHSLQLFFKKSSMNEGQLVGDASLSSSEINTRLGLIFDRCCQFFINSAATVTFSEFEIQLLEFMIQLTVTDKIRCNNFIPWLLLPSSPTELKTYLMNFLLKMLNEKDGGISRHSMIFDDHMIKGILWCLLRHGNQSENDSLNEICSSLGINDKSVMYSVDDDLEKTRSYAQNFTTKQKTSIQNSIYKMEMLAQACIESSMVITRTVTELQNSERKLLMSAMKEYTECYAYSEWTAIIQQMSHEGAPWHCKLNYPKFWELDATEGPYRVHSRLHRVHLELDQRFVLDECEKKATRSPLEYLLSALKQQVFSLNSQVLYNFPAKYVPIDGEIDGELIVTDNKIHFFATYHCKYFYIIFDIMEIAEIWVRRYQHQEKALEIYLETNKSVFIAFEREEDFVQIKHIFCDKIVEFTDQQKITAIVQQWREGGLTNWEYLMSLNQISGRTYNDLMQYPVMPWILSNYTDTQLDLTDAGNFRNLEKPIAVQRKVCEQHYIDSYNYIANTMTNMGTLLIKPYHYSSHYSNSGTVLHFLVRIPPFTGFFLKYQDNNFDIPDRTFHSINTTWLLASRDSPTDVKEIIPEFFCLPEMFENNERFNFGARQSGELVDDVLLPPWSHNDPRLFVFIHRQALESELVRNSLHNWIDLIFGYKQTGQAAIDAVNVFHPSTYSEFLDTQILDPIERKAVETMVKTYGQMPRQLFKSPHPSSKAVEYGASPSDVLPNVKGLRWGAFTGSPELGNPTIRNTFESTGIGTLLAFPCTNVVYGLPTSSTVMQGIRSDTYNLVSWNHPDGMVRIQALTSTDRNEPNLLLHNDSFDEISACGSSPNSNTLWFGHRSGRISVYTCSKISSKKFVKVRQTYIPGVKLSYNSAFWKNSPKMSLKFDDYELRSGEERSNSDFRNMQWNGPLSLIRHTDEITNIALCAEFKIAVSVAKDGIAVIWDMNKLSYVRTILRPSEIHQSPITLVAISPTLGDIITVHSIETQRTNNEGTRTDECFEVTEENLEDFINVSINPNGRSLMRLHSINSKYVNHVVHEDRITAICYSYIKEGIGINVVATALEGGIVRLWASWNLSFVREINTGISDIISLTYSTYHHLCVLTKNSFVQVWESEGLSGNCPKISTNINYK